MQNILISKFRDGYSGGYRYFENKKAPSFVG